MEKTMIAPEIVDRVEMLQVEYADCIDEERYTDWPALFTEQCLYQIISRENQRKKMPFGFLFCDNRRMLRDRIMSMQNANIYEPHTYRHTLSRSLVSEGENGELIAKTSFTVARIMHDGAHELFSTGSYEDRIVNEEGHLRFKSRVVITDSSRIDALLVIPL